MQNIKSAEMFVRNRIKYSAHRCYVANVSASDISYLWHCAVEREFDGCGYGIQCGYIDAGILRAAFMREMSLNPLRFDCVKLDADVQYCPIVTDIVNDIRRILNWFSKRWPNGIQNKIEILDISDDGYRFLVAMRNCFKKIARQNSLDFKRAAYRNEIMAHFAASDDIKIPDDVRAVLRAHAAKTAAQRAQRRADTESWQGRKEAAAAIEQRMKGLLVQMELHVRHDKKYYNELKAEYDGLAVSLGDLMATRPFPPIHGQRAPKRSSATRTPATGTPRAHAPALVAPPQPQPVIKARRVAPAADNDTEESDSVEREMELLRSLTPEHNSDEIFRDYVQHMVGLNLNRHNQKQR